MSEHEINEAIAKACGREMNPDGGWYPDNGLKVGTQAIPDYCNDLNAMHAAEKVLDETQAKCYEAMLGEYGFHASAGKRAEAFLQTLKAAEVRERNEILQELNRIAQQQRWIPVNERLPEVNTAVLTRWRDGVFSVEWRFPSGEWTTGAFVTHWMPLPLPPEEVQG